MRAISFRFQAILERINFYYPSLMNCGAGLYTLAFSETVGFSVVYT